MYTVTLLGGRDVTKKTTATKQTNKSTFVIVFSCCCPLHTQYNTTCSDTYHTSALFFIQCSVHHCVNTLTGTTTTNNSFLFYSLHFCLFPLFFDLKGDTLEVSALHYRVWLRSPRITGTQTDVILFFFFFLSHYFFPPPHFIFFHQDDIPRSFPFSSPFSNCSYITHLDPDHTKQYYPHGTAIITRKQ